MQAFGMLLLAAATAGDGFGLSEPGVGHKNWLRGHVTASSDLPPGGPPYNAAAMAGAGMGAQNGRRFVTTRSQIYFLDPNGLQIGWQNGTGPTGERTYLPAQLTVPARYNFNQGFIYRLKISNIPGRYGVSLYPTIEVAPTTPATDAYLAHNAIPLQFTSEDFDQVIDGGNFVTKVIYLPDPKYQELAISGVETLVSTRLEPGVDPILEADKRGTILLILRLGAIDLESPNLNGSGLISGAPISGGIVNGGIVNGAPINSLPPSNSVAPATELAPGTLPPGVTPAAPPSPGTVVLDPAPTTATPPPPAPRINAPEPPPATAPATPPPPAPGVAPEPAPPAPGEAAPKAPAPKTAEESAKDSETPVTALAPATPEPSTPAQEAPPAEPASAGPELAPAEPPPVSPNPGR
jgi:hypothetical protein